MPPSQNAIAIRITHAVIDAGRNDSTMNPRISQRIPATSHNHQVREYASATGALLLRCQRDAHAHAGVSPSAARPPRSLRHYCRTGHGARDGRGDTLDVLDADARISRISRTVATDGASASSRTTHARCSAASRTTSTTSPCSVEHDGEHVIAITSESVRAPWTTCPAAGAQLQALVGVPLSDRCLEVAGAHRSDQHCTHQLDVATLAVAHAARVTAGGDARRQYDIVVPFGLLDGHRHTVTLARDGEALLAWELEGSRIVAPPPCVGRDRRLRPLGRRHLRRRHRRSRHRAQARVQHRHEPRHRPRQLPDARRHARSQPGVLVDAARARARRAAQPRPDPRLRRAARGDARRGPRLKR